MDDGDAAAGRADSGTVRLYVPDALDAGAVVASGEGDAHYLTRVMRLKPGAPVRLFNGRDGEWAARLTQAAKRRVELTVAARLRVQAAEPAVALAFAPIRKTRLDFLIEKAVELGVSALHPVVTERTQAPRPRRDRLEARIKEAAEQCERLTLPALADPAPLAAFLDAWPAERPLYACLEAGAARALAEALASRETKDVSPPGFVTGPEGGFSPRELALLRERPFVTPVGLGPRVLRAETAALVALAVWQGVRGDGAQRPPARAPGMVER